MNFHLSHLREKEQNYSSQSSPSQLMAYLYSAVQVKNMMVIFDPFSSFDSKYILSLSCFDSSLDSPEN